MDTAEIRQKIEELDSISSADESDNNKEEVKIDHSTKIIVNEENQENIKNILKIMLFFIFLKF